MDLSQVIAGWVVVSVPVSLLIGALISLGSRMPQAIPVRVGRSYGREA